MKRSPLKRKTPLAKQSRKRKAEWPKYLKERAAFLEKWPNCEFPDGGQAICVNRSVDVHHMKRRGKLLRDQRWWMGVCRKHHTWIEDHKNEARAKGLILYK